MWHYHLPVSLSLSLILCVMKLKLSLDMKKTDAGRRVCPTVAILSATLTRRLENNSDFIQTQTANRYLKLWEVFSRRWTTVLTCDSLMVLFSCNKSCFDHFISFIDSLWHIQYVIYEFQPNYKYSISTVGEKKWRSVVPVRSGRTEPLILSR